MAVDCGNAGMSVYGMRAASVSESANAPRTEPRTRPILGRSGVPFRINCAAESACVNWSVIRLACFRVVLSGVDVPFCGTSMESNDPYTFNGRFADRDPSTSQELASRTLAPLRMTFGL